LITFWPRVMSYLTLGHLTHIHYAETSSNRKEKTSSTTFN
jgi:hypothetical protein